MAKKTTNQSGYEFLDKTGTLALIKKIGECRQKCNTSMEDLKEKFLASLDGEAYSSKIYCVASWGSISQSDPDASAFYGNRDIFFDCWQPVLADTTDNDSEKGTTTPYWLMKNNWLRYEAIDGTNVFDAGSPVGEFAPTIGITEDDMSECMDNSVWKIDTDSNTITLIADAGEFDPEDYWTNTDRPLIMSAIDELGSGENEYSDPISFYPTTLWKISAQSDTVTTTISDAGTVSYADSEGGNALSISRIDVSETDNTLTLILSDADNTTEYTGDSFTAISHILRPWETTSTDYTIGIASTYDLYLIDNVTGDSGENCWRGVFTEPVMWDGFNVSDYLLKAGTAVNPGPCTIIDSKTRNFFFTYYTGEDSCYGFYSSSYGTHTFDGRISYGNRTYPHKGISGITNMQYGRNNNSDTESPVPFAEGGYHARNVFICGFEAAYGTKYLHDPELFGGGFSCNDACDSESDFFGYGGFRYKKNTEDEWEGYAKFNSNVSAIRYNSNGSYTSAYVLAGGGNQLITECNESQMALSFAQEIGIPTGIWYEFYGAPYMYEDIITDSTSDLYKYCPENGYLNARVYRIKSDTWDLYDLDGNEVTWDIEFCLRFSLFLGKLLCNSNSHEFTHGGFETIRTYPNTSTTNDVITSYLQPDQALWAYNTDYDMTSNKSWDFEEDYINLGTIETDYSNRYFISRQAFGAVPINTGASSISTYECAYGYFTIGDSGTQHISIGYKRRMGLIFSYFYWSGIAAAPRSYYACFPINTSVGYSAASAQFMCTI